MASNDIAACWRAQDHSHLTRRRNTSDGHLFGRIRINSASDREEAVGSVDYGIDFQFGDVTL